MEALPCRLSIAGKARHSGVVVLRCECMAQTRSRPSRRFFGYDPIGEYTDLRQALIAWADHVESKGNSRPSMEEAGRMLLESA